MCGSIPVRRSSTSFRDYNSSLDGKRTQENAILYTLKKTSDGATMDTLQSGVRDIVNRGFGWVPPTSIRRAVQGLRSKRYNISVTDGIYRLNL